ncbi:MAG TPA: transposase [Chloroflexota bacterium]|nr:transposase [Chloroflexota bacterium]
MEHRALWVLAAGELGPYLAREFGWPDVQQVGWVRRRWRRLHEATGRGDDTRVWITNLPRSRAGPAALAARLRGHWTIENPVHWVRDVSWNEDRGHGRAVGVGLATLRNTALNVLRGRGFALMPDGRRWLAAQPDVGLTVLTRPLER